MNYRPAKSFLQLLVDLFSPAGPKEERRKRSFAIFVGEVTDPNGGRAASKLTVPEGYTCTALTTIEILQRILENQYKTGFQTPSLACGKDFIVQFDGVKREDLL